jgi:hypothetical protein
MVGVLGFEPRASRSQSERATAAPHPEVTVYFFGNYTN